MGIRDKIIKALFDCDGWGVTFGNIPASYGREADAILALEIEGRHIYPNRIKTIKCKSLGCAVSCEDRICKVRRPMTIRDLI